MVLLEYEMLSRPKRPYQQLTFQPKQRHARMIPPESTNPRTHAAHRLNPRIPTHPTQSAHAARNCISIPTPSSPENKISHDWPLAAGTSKTKSRSGLSCHLLLSRQDCSDVQRRQQCLPESQLHKDKPGRISSFSTDTARSRGPRSTVRVQHDPSRAALERI